MRVSWTLAALALCCAGSLTCAIGAEQHLALKGQLYFEGAPAGPAPQTIVPRHVPSQHIARAPIDFSYPETAASTGSHLTHQDQVQPLAGSGWDLDLTDGAKLKFAYDRDTKLSLGMGMWKVKVGVSKKFGGSSRIIDDPLVRHGSAAGMGRSDANLAGPASD